MRKVSAIGIVSLALLAAVFVVLNARTTRGAGDATATITQLENEGVKADLAGDMAWTKKNLAEDFVGGDSFGAWETKADALKDAEEAAKNKVKSESMSHLKVNVHGDVAVARYTESYDRMYKGVQRARTIICTDTWVSESGTWKELASHCSQTK